MKLKKIIFNNFRQFYGEQVVNLETTSEKNLVVIHAENNVGKTTFLKGFTWCLFKKESFKRKAYLNDYIFSQLDKDETEIASVTLIFDNRGEEYFLKRSIEVSNISGNQYPVDESFELKIGGEEIQSNKQDKINRILNPDLSNYFFFEGESVGEMALPENKDNIKEGIQYIMGLEVYSRALRHTENAKEDFKKSLKKLTEESGEENSPLVKKTETESNIKNKEKEISNLEKYIKRKEEIEKKDIKEKLIISKDVERFEKEIQRLEKEIIDLKEEDIDVFNTLKKNISRNAYLSMSQVTIKKMDSFLKNKRIKGELPSNIREQFVHDLLDEEECICGTTLKNNENARERLEALLKKTVNTDIENCFIDVHGFINIQTSSNNFMEQLKNSIKHRAKLSERLDDVNERLSEEKLNREQHSGESTKELLAKLESVELIIKEKSQLVGEYKEELKKLNKDLVEVMQKLQNYHTKNSKIERESNRLILAEKTYELINDEYQTLTDKVRERLSAQVSDIFDSIIHGNYKIKINDEFELELTKVVNDQEGETELSRGQEQIASLSFIAALVHIAKKWDEENKHDVWGGAGVYPMVIDSPFGTLGQFYQSSLTKKLRDLAPQIIIMVSSTQWTEEVQNNFAKYCQYEYVFQHQHPMNVRQRFEPIIINDGSYDLEQINEFEYTKIVEVR